jgi:predicted transcriptional regulator
MADKATENEVLVLTAEIVASHVSNNSVALADLPELIRQIHASLRATGVPANPIPDRPPPAVPIKRSVTADYIVCLEDGKKLKTLKRHLKTRYNMSPDQYRERWGLPADYPMVAPSYAARRSALAKQIGLGTKRRRRG